MNPIPRNPQPDRIRAAVEKNPRKMTLQLARDKAEGLVDKEVLVTDAQRRAGQIIDQAKMDAENIKIEADQYALDVLMNLQTELEHLSNQAHNGVQVLLQKRQPQEPLPQEK